jgi:isoleucyl-tRNA synthetase
MEYAQRICSLVHSIRKNARIKVRTPLQKIVLPILDESFAKRIKSVEEIILAEVNVKAIEYMSDTSGVVVKKIKPNFQKLGKQYGARMKEVAAVVQSMNSTDISELERQGILSKDGFEFTLEDVIISSEDIPGWAVANDAGITVALDLTVTEALRQEGIARDFVNRVQNLRKDMGLEVLDKITIEVQKDSEAVLEALTTHSDYIRTETQALALNIGPYVDGGVDVAMDECMLKVKISVSK